MDQQTTQSRLFNETADALVESVLEGYNATVFAYGQTGSGKTVSMTGGAKHDEDRGIIPRSLQKIFAEISKVGVLKLTEVATNSVVLIQSV